MARWVVRLPESGATPDDYEAAIAPLYAWMNALTQRSDHAVLSAGSGASARAWVALAGTGRHHRPLRMAALGAGYVTAVAALNAAGLGPLDRNLSGAALRRGGLHGIREVLRRLGVIAPHLVWGHSHRSGPWPSDELGEWTTPAGTRILNTGSWVYQRHFLSERPNETPYWPGTAVLLEDAAPPRLIRLLGERGTGSWRHPGVKHVAWHVRPSPTASSRTPACGAGCSISGWQPVPGISMTPPQTSTSPPPSKTPHTPPASYGPEYAPGWSSVWAGSSTPGASSGAAAARFALARRAAPGSRARSPGRRPRP
jgi:hypothetical protein